jgi:hypothetical protein
MSDDFADGIDNEKSENSEFTKTVYMRLEDGHKYTIRILEPKAKKIFTHFLGGKYSVLCLGDNCPICKRTLELYQQYPETFRKESGYNPRQKRYYVNVLDKTPVKRCPKCNKEYANLNMGICNDCSVALEGPVPSNTVKVLSKGPAVFGQFNDIHSSVVDDDGNKLGIHTFDLDLTVNGKGKDTRITVIPLPHKNKPVEGKFELFDLSSPVPELTPEEMLDVQRGVSLKDIYVARKAEKDMEFGPEAVDANLEEEVNEAVNKLFNS